MFLFPSNGTAFLNPQGGEGNDYEKGQVSIPFKREGVSERNHSQRIELQLEAFLFPSNGKAFLNSGQSLIEGRRRLRVSIPFNRDGVSELLCF